MYTDRGIKSLQEMNGIMNLFVLGIVTLITNVVANGKFQSLVSVDKNGSKPLPYENWTGKRVMFITAHIDDMEGTSAGLVALLDGKAEVSLVILTNSDKGCGNVEICTNKTAADVASIRQKEQINSAQILGIKQENINFLTYEDCLLNTYPSVQIEQELVGFIRNFQPHIVLAWDPQPYYELLPSEGWQDLGFHPDHQSSGKLALDAAWNAHLIRLWPQLGAGWRMEELYFFAFTPSKTPDFYVDVTGAPFDKKVSAFLEMKSQFTDEEAAEVELYYKLINSRVAKNAGLPLGTMAEAFNYILW